MKLIRIAGKSREFWLQFPGTRQEHTGFAFERMDNPDDYRERGEFHLVHDERDVPFIVEHLAKENPGKEIQVWDLDSISICPAAPMVTKQVTKDGILPS